MTITGIEWTDATWNPVTGCAKVSPGCAHCYAETVAARFWPTQYQQIPIEKPADLDATCTFTRDRQFTDVQCHEDRLDQPLRWKKPRRIFVNSMSDLFHEAVPDAFIDKVFAVMALAPQHTFQVLTKRAARLRDYMVDPYRLLEVTRHIHAWLGDAKARALSPIPWPLPNVWLGVSVENQHFADERIPLLLQTPAAVRFISAEPLLGGVDLSGFIPKLQPWKPYVECRHGYDACPMCDSNPKPALDWVIVGGESGPGARPMRLEWAESILAQCRAAGVPAFVKQLGSSWRGISFRVADGLNQRITDRKGGDMAEWPEDLRVREFPRAVKALC